MREDDPSIDGGTLLYRRVPPAWVVPDKNRNCQKLASAAFEGDEMSVVVGDTLAEIHKAPESILDDYPSFSLVSFSTDLARSADLAQIVCRDPEDDGPAHGLVVGKKTEGRKRRLARGSAWVVAPAGACEPPAV
jgi:hypothetical protein